MRAETRTGKRWVSATLTAIMVPVLPCLILTTCPQEPWPRSPILSSSPTSVTTFYNTHPHITSQLQWWLHPRVGLEYCDEHVCVSVCSNTESGTMCNNFTMHITCSSVVLWCNCNILHTTGFEDDIFWWLDTTIAASLQCCAWLPPAVCGIQNVKEQRCEISLQHKYYYLYHQYLSVLCIYMYQ